MPRANKRQRIVTCDCKECAEVTNSPDDYEWEAAAKQLPPPRSLLLLLEGFNSAPSVASAALCCTLEEVTLPHLDTIARQGVTFCAAIRRGARDRHCLGVCARDRTHACRFARLASR